MERNLHEGDAAQHKVGGVCRDFALLAVSGLRERGIPARGITRTLQVAKMSEAVGIPVTPHAANLSLVTMCTMHLLRALPSAGRYLEYSIEKPRFAEDLFVGEPFKVEHGQVVISDEPGWGVSYSQRFLNRQDTAAN
uniref:enolase C-terminal domain-like protein n=1 Tax=Neorhizobium sp. EC2-8 TaxID=3129230 RepID=UPI0031019C1E